MSTAAPPLSLSHFERSFPSKSTIASEGGLPGCSAVLLVPGVTTRGCGRVRSWIGHLISAAAAATAAAAAKARTA